MCVCLCLFKLALYTPKPIARAKSIENCVAMCGKTNNPSRINPESQLMADMKSFVVFWKPIATIASFYYISVTNYVMDR